MLSLFSRPSLVVAVLCGGLATALQPASAQTDSASNDASDSSAQNHPNVVMIISDDQAWTDYSFMEHETIETPNLDELAAESLTFTRGYVPDSLCRPSLATIISGLYPHQHGIVGNDPPWPGMEQGRRRPRHQSQPYVQRRREYLQHVDAMTTAPDYLSEFGYKSMQTGKWWEGNYRRGGFTSGMTVGDFTKSGRHGDAGLTIGRQGLQPIEEFVDQCQSEDAPFYLWYAPFLPHTPHTPPQRLLDKYRERTDSLPIAKYWAMCEWFDESVGDLMSLLDERGLSDDTILMYVCDNGWINRPDRSRYAERSKRSPNEGGIRTPIMVRWPGKVQPEMDKTTLVSSIDLVPTMLNAVGLPVPEKLPGLNLLDSEALNERDAIFGEIFEHDIQAMADPAASLRYRWVIEGRYKLIEPSSRLGDESAQLYDVIADPHEKNNLADEQPDVVSRLRERLNEWWNPRTS